MIAAGVGRAISLFARVWKGEGENMMQEGEPLCGLRHRIRELVLLWKLSENYDCR